MQVSDVGAGLQVFLTQEGVTMYAPPPPVLSTQISSAAQISFVVTAPAPLHCVPHAAVWMIQTPLWQRASVRPLVAQS